MLKKILNNKIIGYGINFLISAAIDLSIYAIIFHLLNNYFKPEITIPIATVVARIVSSLCNFKLNMKLFLNKDSKSIEYLIRYYILWTVVLISSSSLVTYIYTNIQINEIVAKAIADLFIGIFSYTAQRVWVFNKSGKGIFFRVIRIICRIFVRRKILIKKEEFKEPKVFVAHHQNFYAPVTSLIYMPNSVSIWAIAHLCTFKGCFDKYYNYTFIKTLKIPRPIAFVFSVFLALLIPMFLKSAKAIPVYRKEKNILETFKISIEELKKGRQIIVFPDIKYNSKETNIEQIYTGFINIDEYYFKQTKEHIEFVPLVFDKKNKMVISKNGIKLNSKENIEKENIVSYIIKSINEDE